MKKLQSPEQIQKIEESVGLFGSNIRGIVFGNVKVISPSDLVRDVSLDQKLADGLRPLLSALRAEIATETLRSSFGSEEHNLTVVRQDGKTLYLLAIPDELLASDNQVYRDALNILRAFFSDNFPGARLFILHLATPFVYYTAHFSRLCRNNGLSLTFLSLSNLKDLELLPESERTQTLATLFELEQTGGAVPTVRQAQADDLNNICQVIQRLGLYGADELEALMERSSLDYLRPGLKLEGKPETAIWGMVKKAADTGFHKDKPGFHCLGLLLRTLCDDSEIKPEDKQDLVRLLEQCALLPAGEIQRLKR